MDAQENAAVLMTASAWLVAGLRTNPTRDRDCLRRDSSGAFAGKFYGDTADRLILAGIVFRPKRSEEAGIQEREWQRKQML